MRHIYLVTYNRLDYDDYPIGALQILGAYGSYQLALVKCMTVRYGDVVYPAPGYSIVEVEYQEE